MTGDPTLGRTIPAITDPLAQLGMKLFFSKSLGGEFDSACVTCHHPALGGGDGLPISIGVEALNPDLLGPGRTHVSGALPVPRNAPTTFNISLIDSALFWDGRVESLGKTAETNGDDGLGIRTPDTDFGLADALAGSNIPTAQSRYPVTSPDEMRADFLLGGSNQELREALAQRLSDRGWGPEFVEAFGDSTITDGRVAAAIGEYERSQTFVDNAWKRFLDGDSGAISESAKRGAELFLNARDVGGAGCFTCHSGDRFTDERFWAIAAPQVGPGKGDGALSSNDFGRARETEDSSQRYNFRTPSLLNVEVTGPYTHAGAFSTLTQVVEHHLDPNTSLTSFDVTQVAPAFTDDFSANTAEMLAEISHRPLGTIATLFSPITLTEQEVEDLVEFLKALTDPCVKDRNCLDAWVPGEELADVDGQRLVAVGSDGAPL